MGLIINKQFIGCVLDVSFTTLGEEKVFLGRMEACDAIFAVPVFGQQGLCCNLGARSLSSCLNKSVVETSLGTFLRVFTDSQKSFPVTLLRDKLLKGLLREEFCFCCISDKS